MWQSAPLDRLNATLPPPTRWTSSVRRISSLTPLARLDLSRVANNVIRDLRAVRAAQQGRGLLGGRQSHEHCRPRALGCEPARVGLYLLVESPNHDHRWRLVAAEYIDRDVVETVW